MGCAGVLHCKRLFSGGRICSQIGLCTYVHAHKQLSNSRLRHRSTVYAPAHPIPGKLRKKPDHVGLGAVRQWQRSAMRGRSARPFKIRRSNMHREATVFGWFVLILGVLGIASGCEILIRGAIHAEGSSCKALCGISLLLAQFFFAHSGGRCGGIFLLVIRRMRSFGWLSSPERQIEDMVLNSCYGSFAEAAPAPACLRQKIHKNSLCHIPHAQRLLSF